MPETTSTVLIFGRSPFISKVDTDKLLSLGYTTFGINNHGLKTDYTAFVDEAGVNMQESMSGTIITQSRHEVREPFIYFDYFEGDLTHDYLLKWLHGRCARAILVGCADFLTNTHYNSSEKFEPDEGAIKRSIEFIEGIKDFKVYKMNGRGVLNIPCYKLEK